jgi:hypothetical protein
MMIKSVAWWAEALARLSQPPPPPKKKKHLGRGHMLPADLPAGWSSGPWGHFVSLRARKDLWVLSQVFTLARNQNE